MPVDLHPKPEPKKPRLTPMQLFIIAFILIFILTIIFVWISRGSYYYNYPLT